MAIYPDRDIAVGVEGDLVINDKGDIDLATSIESVEDLLKNIIATDLGEFDVLPYFGANLGALIGKSMREVMDRLPVLVRDGIRRSNYIDPGDVYVDVYPIDFDKVLMFIDFKGTFINSDGEEVAYPSTTLKFYFPYSKERIMEWSNAS